MQRVEVVAAKRVGPREISALQLAVVRFMAADPKMVRSVEVSEAEGRARLEMDLSVHSARRATRKAETAFTHVWYDAFGESEPTHDVRSLGKPA